MAFRSHLFFAYTIYLSLFTPTDFAKTELTLEYFTHNSPPPSKSNTALHPILALLQDDDGQSSGVSLALVSAADNDVEPVHSGLLQNPVIAVETSHYTSANTVSIFGALADVLSQTTESLSFLTTTEPPPPPTTTVSSSTTSTTTSTTTTTTTTTTTPPPTTYSTATARHFGRTGTSSEQVQRWATNAPPHNGPSVVIGANSVHHKHHHHHHNHLEHPPMTTHPIPKSEMTISSKELPTRPSYLIESGTRNSVSDSEIPAAQSYTHKDTNTVSHKATVSVNPTVTTTPPISHTTTHNSSAPNHLQTVYIKSQSSLTHNDVGSKLSKHFGIERNLEWPPMKSIPPPSAQLAPQKHITNIAVDLPSTLPTIPHTSPATVTTVTTTRAPQTISDFTNERSRLVTSFASPTHGHAIYRMPDTITRPYDGHLLTTTTTAPPTRSSIRHPPSAVPTFHPIPLAGSESVAGTVAPSLASLTTRPAVARSQTPRLTTAVPFGYKPRFVHRIPILPLGARSLGAADPTSANIPMPVLERDYTVFGILPNRSVVVRVDAATVTTPQPSVDAPVVYGILANNTLVRRLPNGTVVQVHSVNSGAHLRLTDIDANSLINPSSELYRRPSITEAFLSTVSTWAVTPTLATKPMATSHDTAAASEPGDVAKPTPGPAADRSQTDSMVYLNLHILD